MVSPRSVLMKVRLQSPSGLNSNESCSPAASPVHTLQMSRGWGDRPQESSRDIAAAIRITSLQLFLNDKIGIRVILRGADRARRSKINANVVSSIVRSVQCCGRVALARNNRASIMNRQLNPARRAYFWTEWLFWDRRFARLGRRVSNPTVIDAALRAEILPANIGKPITEVNRLL